MTFGCIILQGSYGLNSMFLLNNTNFDISTAEEIPERIQLLIDSSSPLEANLMTIVTQREMYLANFSRMNDQEKSNFVASLTRMFMRNSWTR